MTAQKPIVLVAEDDRNDRFLFQRAADRAGLDFCLQFVKDGHEVIEFLERQRHNPPSVLLLDLKMPLMNGFEVLEWLNQHPETRPGYVVVLSASGHGHDLHRAWSLGVDHYLVKPTEPAELISILKRLEPYWLEQRPFLVQQPPLAPEVALASAA